MPDAAYYKAHRDVILRQVKEWRKKNLDKVKEYNRRYRKRGVRRRSEREVLQSKARVAKWRADNLARWNRNKRAAWKRRNRRDKMAALRHYGGRCACCGEENIGFLTMDHINNDGAAHRRDIKVIGSGIWSWLRRNGYPKGFRVMCWNCNCGRAFNGGMCPHKRPASYG